MKIKKVLLMCVSFACCMSLLAGCTPNTEADDAVIDEVIDGDLGTDDVVIDVDDSADDGNKVNVDINLEGEYDDQYRLLAENVSMWMTKDSMSDPMGDYYAYYRVTDMDQNGLIEVWYSNHEHNEIYGYEVTADKKGLREISIGFDTTDFIPTFYFYSGYKVNTGRIYYGDTATVTTDDAVRTELFLLSLNDGKLELTDIGYSTYAYKDGVTKYFDADGNEVGYEGYSKLGIDSMYSDYEYFTVLVDGESAYDICGDSFEETDAYYFVEHSHRTFIGGGYDYDNFEITFYDDPNSKEYRDLEDVIVLDSPCKSGTPVRIKVNYDMNFIVESGEWDDAFGKFVTDDTSNYILRFNRVYEIMIDTTAGDSKRLRLAADYNYFFPSKDLFAGSKGGATYNVRELRKAEELTEDSKYVQILGMVAYQLGKEKSVDDFAYDKYWQTYAKAVSACYGVVPSRGTFEFDYMTFYAIEGAFFNWRTYYDSAYEYENEYVKFDAGSWDYTIQYDDYTVDDSAIEKITIQKDPDGVGYDNQYLITYTINYGKTIKKIGFYVAYSDSVAFSYEAYFVTME